MNPLMSLHYQSLWIPLVQFYSNQRKNSRLLPHAARSLPLPWVCRSCPPPPPPPLYAGTAHVLRGCHHDYQAHHRSAARVNTDIQFNTLRPRQNGRHFPDDIFKCISLKENVWISIKMSLKFVPKGSVHIGSDNGLEPHRRQVIITLVRHKKARFDSKMHGSTQKSPVRHKNARFDTKMPSPACISWHCHYQTSPPPLPPWCEKYFFPILFQYFVFKNP